MLLRLFAVPFVVNGQSLLSAFMWVSGVDAGSCQIFSVLGLLRQLGLRLDEDGYLMPFSTATFHLMDLLMFICFDIFQ